MINSIKYFKFIGMGTSIAFTILMLQTFASNLTEHILYFVAALIPEICKIILLLSGMYFYCRKKSLGIKLFAFFVPFFCISLASSISFTLYTIQKQMYIVEIIEDTAYSYNYKVIQQQISNINDNILTIEAERVEERNRFNALIDSLSAEHVMQRRRLLEDRELLMDSYETRISDMQSELHIRESQLIEINDAAMQNQTVIENRRLSDNSVAGFFSTISNITGANIETIILWYAIILGIILDSCGVALAYVETKLKSDLNENKCDLKEKDLDETILENEQISDDEIDMMLDMDENDAVVSIVGGKAKILNMENTYKNFVDCILKNNLNASKLKFEEFREYYPEIPNSTYYKHIKTYRIELGLIVD